MADLSLLILPFLTTKPLPMDPLNRILLNKQATVVTVIRALLIKTKPLKNPITP